MYIAYSWLYRYTFPVDVMQDTDNLSRGVRFCLDNQWSPGGGYSVWELAEVCGRRKIKAQRSQNWPSKKRKDRIFLSLENDKIENLLRLKAK